MNKKKVGKEKSSLKKEYPPLFRKKHTVFVRKNQMFLFVL